jgi:hypothetical protein
MGTNLVTKELVGKQDYAGIEARVRSTIRLIRAIRGK